jgi:hypothetical protein
VGAVVSRYVIPEYAAHHVPHPWDAIGSPPPLGVPYERVASDVDHAAIDAYLSKRRESDELEEEAGYARDEADRATRDADGMLADLDVSDEWREKLRDGIDPREAVS